MSLVKIALNRMTKFLDALKTNVEKESFRKKVFQGLSRTQEFKPTTLLHSAINRRGNFTPGQLLRPEGQMATGIHNYIHHNKEMASKTLGPIKSKLTPVGKELESHVSVGQSKRIKIQYPQNNGNLERSLIGAHESHELLEHAGDVKAKGKYFARNYRRSMALRKDVMHNQTERLGSHPVSSHFSNGVLGRDSNLLSRNFHPLEVSGGGGALRASNLEDIHFKQVSGKEFGTKVNKHDLVKLRTQSSNKKLGELVEAAYPNLSRVEDAAYSGLDLRGYYRKKVKPMYQYNYNLNIGRKGESTAIKLMSDIESKVKEKFPSLEKGDNGLQTIKDSLKSRQMAEELAKDFNGSRSLKHKLVVGRKASNKEKLMINRLGAKEYSYDYTSLLDDIKNKTRKKYALPLGYTDYKNRALPSIAKMNLKRTNNRVIDGGLLAKGKRATEEYHRLTKLMQKDDLPVGEWSKLYEKQKEIHRQFPSVKVW